MFADSSEFALSLRSLLLKIHRASETALREFNDPEELTYQIHQLMVHFHDMGNMAVAEAERLLGMQIGEFAETVLKEVGPPDTARSRPRGPASPLSGSKIKFNN